MGFALAGGPLDILLVFATLGLGLALPYLLVAALPGLATRLPRPGRWMFVLRRVLGLVLASTAVWLLSVLAGQVGVTAALLVGALLVSLGLIFLLGRGWRGTARAGAVAALALAAFVVPAGFAATVAPPPAAGDAGQWRAFDQAEIERQLSMGQLEGLLELGGEVVVGQVFHGYSVRELKAAVKPLSEKGTLMLRPPAS